MATVERERAVMTINMGPQHPSTHGVFRLILTLEGETVVDAEPVIGYLHTAIEKEAEHKTYHKIITLNDRLDYVSGMTNNFAYCLAVEKLLGIEPPLRGQYLRVIVSELQRIASHLVFLGTMALEIGIMSAFFYCFREREKILDLFEMICGARLTYSYIIVGGVRYDLPDGWVEKCREFIREFPKAWRELDELISKNPIWLNRTKGIGVLKKEDAIAWGVTGPSLRASGVPWDLRKTMPYSSYDHFDFELVTAEEGDTYARYWVRMLEMMESLKIVRQALDNLPSGSVLADHPWATPPPKNLLDKDMEALIRHFLFYSRGYPVPPGETYAAVESARGEVGFYIVSDGSEKPYRMHMRAPSFIHVHALPVVAKGHLVADLVAILASFDPVMGEVDR
ncbi:MAG: NADH dehydrogenase (quinone) subunit D [Armatimonadota bacterium]|nr:NADH dehydrogenase (quinone) subunit D [Armatimonadota bacterium]MDW8142240.1 NADH dehydrogenase (quinone) subunit D [Armatimonadota bacterium]